MNHPQRRFDSRAEWIAPFGALGISALKTLLGPVKIATQGALWGAAEEASQITNTVIIRDNAGQFNVGIHALCWIHAERLLRKLACKNPLDCMERDAKQKQIWEYYRQLKDYCENPS